MLSKLFILAASVTVLSTSAHAARVMEVSGTVLVNRGQGFQAVAVSAALKPGDRVVALSDSSARIAYGVDCVTHLKANQTFIVPSEAVCHTGAVDGSLKDEPAIAEPADVGSRELILGGLVLGGVGAAVALSGDDKPASGE